MLSGYSLREIRELRGMTVEELATASDVAQPMIEKFERCKGGLSVHSARKLCKVLRVKVTYEVDGKKVRWGAGPRL